MSDLEQTRSSVDWMPDKARLTRTLDAIADHAEHAEAVRKADLDFGDVVIVRTRNSIYSLCAMGDGNFAVSGGWFDARNDSPAMVTVQGCTYGGSVIRLDIVAARGLFLEFGNNVSTTRILEVSVLRHGANSADGPAAPLAC